MHSRYSRGRKAAGRHRPLGVDTGSRVVTGPVPGTVGMLILKQTFKEFLSRPTASGLRRVRFIYV
jgi:hypothetical protein